MKSNTTKLSLLTERVQGFDTICAMESNNVETLTLTCHPIKYDQFPKCYDLRKKTWKLDIIQIISQKGNFSTSCKTSETAVKTSYTQAANVVCSS